jgi:hypothetical protein
MTVVSRPGTGTSAVTTPGHVRIAARRCYLPMALGLGCWAPTAKLRLDTDRSR